MDHARRNNLEEHRGFLIMHGADEQLEREQDFKQLSKKGCFEQLEMLWDGGQRFDLAKSFELAVTDFRTIRRNAGHMQILKFCIDRGLDPLTRVDWMRQPLICTASMYGNHEIVSYIVEKCGQPEAPMVRASLGDVAFFLRDSAQPAEELRELRDENGFNLLHYAVASGLGRVNSEFRSKQEETCRFLIESGVKTDLAVNNNIEITPALLCTWFCGNSNIMQMLLDADEIEISSLHQAVEFAFEPHQRSGKPFEDVANVILENGFDINSIRPDQNRTLLHGSSNRGAIAAVAWLLANGANPNLVDESGRTSLHVAAIRNTHDRVVRKLIECGAKIDTCDANGKTALELAKENNRQNVSTFLGSIENDQGESAKPIAKLIGAIKDADLSTVTEILHAHPNLANTPIESLTKNRSQTLLHLAMPGDGRQDSVAHVGIVKLLIECGAVVDALGEGPNLGTCTPLTIAGWGGHVRLIEPLIKNGANVDGHPDSEQSPLQAAARHGHSEAVEALVVAGARYELAELVMAGLENRVKELLHANPELVNEPTESGATLLHAALESNRGSSLVPMLLELGADKARRDATGRTPLQMAIEQQIWWDFSKYVSALKDEASTENIFVAAGLGEVEKVRGLIEHNEDLAQKKQTDGTTPLFYAVISKDLETVKTLLEAGADPSPQSNRFWACLTPLHLALQTRQPEIARALLEAGADANVRGPSPDRWQPSPLAIANHWKAPGHFEALVQYGADMHTAEVVGWAMSAEDTKPLELLLGLGVNLKHPAWENALDVAMENGREQTAEMLRSQLIDSN